MQMLASGWPAASTACAVANPPEEQNLLDDCQEANCAQTKAAAEKANAFTMVDGEPIDSERWATDAT